MALAEQPRRPHSLALATVEAKPKLSRRASLEDYQRRVVEKIKRHLDKRRNQWETSLQKQAEVFNTSSNQSLDLQEEQADRDSDACSVGSRSGVTTTAGDSTVTSAATDDADEVSQVSSQSFDMEAELRVLRARCDKQKKAKVSRWTFDLDISDFLPDGEVLISTGDRTLTATGHPAKKKSRGSGSNSSKAAVKIQMELDGEVDSRTLHVTTSNSGVMTIQITAKQEKTNSVFYC